MTEAKKDDAPASFKEIADFMQKMWNPFGVAMPGFGMPAAPPAGPGVGAMPGGMPYPHPAAMFATLDPADLEHKINDLRVIEGWLQMSLNMMQLSIKTMELQKASLEALRSPQGSAKSDAPPGGRR